MYGFGILKSKEGKHEERRLEKHIHHLLSSEMLPQQDPNPSLHRSDSGIFLVRPVQARVVALAAGELSLLDWPGSYRHFLDQAKQKTKDSNNGSGEARAVS